MSDFIEQIKSGARVETRKLIALQRTATCQPTQVAVTLETYCPDKYAIVDLETGELWGHNGASFRRLSEAEASDVAYVARMASGAQGTHPDDVAVDRFAAALKAKLADGRQGDRSGGDDPAQCSAEDLAGLLVKHLAKGNPGNFLEVAAFAMMLHERRADPAVLAAAAARECNAIRGVLAALRNRCDDHALRLRLTELIAEIDARTHG